MFSCFFHSVDYGHVAYVAVHEADMYAALLNFFILFIDVAILLIPLLLLLLLLPNSHPLYFEDFNSSFPFVIQIPVQNGFFDAVTLNVFSLDG